MIPLFPHVRRQAMRERRTIKCRVMMATDEIKLVQFGPRGGWRVVS
jgi:hypothetical protein